MLLASSDRADCIAEFNPSSGTLRFLNRRLHTELQHSKSHGSYSCVDGVIVLFYRMDADLHVRIGEEDFVIDDEVQSRLSDDGQLRTFALTRGDDTLTAFRYVPTRPLVPIEMDPTPFVGEEDYDLLMRVNSVLHNEERRANIFGPRG